MFGLLKQTFQEWNEDKAPVLAAAIAYYTVFSLAPLLIIVIAVLSLFFGQDGQAQAQLVTQLEGFFGPDSGVPQTIVELLAERESSGGNLLASFIGFVILIVGATGVFAQLQSALNQIWNVEAKPKANGILQLLRVRLLSLGMVLVIGFLLLVSLVLSALVSALSGALGNALPGSDFIWQLLNFVISLAVISAVFAFMFKYLPDIEVAWRDVIVGGFVTGLLFVIGKSLIGLYLGSSGVASSYGAAGSLVVLLLWVFYSAQIVLLGGEFTQVYAKRYGAGVKPAPHATFQEA